MLVFSRFHIHALSLALRLKTMRVQIGHKGKYIQLSRSDLCETYISVKVFGAQCRGCCFRTETVAFQKRGNHTAE
jgi:hypothetical protein